MKKLGRPKKPKGEAKSLMVRARVSPVEFKAVSKAAELTGKGLSEWSRDVLLAAATGSNFAFKSEIVT